MAVRSKLRKISTRPTGHHPKKWRAREKEAFSLAAISHKTTRLLIVHENVTALILARITDGASLLRVGDGRVVGFT